MTPKEPDRQDSIQQLNWEKPKRPVKNFFPPTWETPTSNRYNKLHSDEKNTIVNDNSTNDPVEIQLANVKLKRKVQYLQKNVEGSQPPSGNTLGHEGQKTPAIALKCSDTSRPASHEELSNAHMKNNRQNQRTSRKEEGSSTYVVGDSMINGMDERKMSNRRRVIKVRAHPGASISDMLDYLRPILRKKPTHLVLHAGTNDIRNLSPEEILDQFDKVNDVVTRDSPETSGGGGGGRVTCIRHDTGMCDYFGYFFGGCSWIFGYLLGLFPDFWVSFFGYSWIFGDHFLVKFDFFKNNPNFGVLILIFPSMTLWNVACRALVSMILQFSLLFYHACAKSSILSINAISLSSYICSAF